MRVHADNKISLVLTLMAGASLVSMVATFTIDRIVHHDLYAYGLQFSRQWAVPYWTMSAVVFSMGWLMILTSIGFQLHLVMHRLHRPLKPETPIRRQGPIRNEVPGTVKVTASNTGTTPLTINELWVNDVRQTSVSPALPCTIQSNDETMFVVSTNVKAGCSYQVRLVSARGNAFTYTVTARPREMPRMKAKPTEDPVEKQVMTTALAVKKEQDELSGFRVLPEETSVTTSGTVTRKKADDKPKNE